MIKALLRLLLPVAIRKPYYVLKDRWYTYRSRLTPFDLLFPAAEKRSIVASVEVPAPGLSDMTLMRPQPYFLSDHYIVPEDYVVVLENVLYCSVNNVVFTEEGKILSESHNVTKRRLQMDRIRRPGHIMTIGGTTTLLRSNSFNYYHTLVDSLPRLLALDTLATKKYGIIQALCPTKVLRTEAFFLEKFGLPNVQPLVLDPGVTYRLERLLFTPYKTRISAGYLPASYVAQFREKVLPKRPAQRNKRIFITREHNRKGLRCIANREALEAYLCGLGFKTYAMESLTLQEQIDLFYDAEVVVAAHGAGLTNMLFAPAGLKVLELHPAQAIGTHYYFLSQSLGHVYKGWYGEAERKDVPHFTIDIPAVARLLDEFALARWDASPVGLTG